LDGGQFSKVFFNFTKLMLRFKQAINLMLLEVDVLMHANFDPSPKYSAKINLPALPQASPRQTRQQR
jgi:hypothetical protein